MSPSNSRLTKFLLLSPAANKAITDYMYDAKSANERHEMLTKAFASKQKKSKHRKGKR